MKIAIIGSGAMGSMMGAKLHRAGNDVTLIDVWKDHVKKINSEGLLLRKNGDEGERVMCKAVMSAEDMEGQVELALVFVKGIFTDNAVQGAMSIIGPETYVLTMQNGLGNADIIAKYVEPSKVIMGTTLGAAGLIGPGDCNDTTVTPPDGIVNHIVSYTRENNDRVHEIARVLTEASIPTEASANAEVAIWEKLVVNCCVNAPCLISRLNCGDFISDPDGDALLDGITREIIMVAQLKGIPLNYEHMRKKVIGSLGKSSHHPSMSQDAFKKSRTEIETISGAVVREGRKLGAPTPVNSTMCHLVRCIENNYEKLWY